jgi:hypothetical protein
MTTLNEQNHLADSDRRNDGDCKMREVRQTREARHTACIFAEALSFPFHMDQPHVKPNEVVKKDAPERRIA